MNINDSMNCLIKVRFPLLLVLTCCLVLLMGLPSQLNAASPAAGQWQPAHGQWRPVAPHREDRGAIKVVWLQGTPYEMGYQHGTLLHNEIASLGPNVLEGLNFAGKTMGLGKLAMRRSFPDVVEECRGLVAATQDLGMTMDSCMIVAFGDVYQELFAHTLPDILFHDGCSTFAAAGDATIDGRLYQGRSLDQNNKPIEYWIKNPTVFVRQPSDGIPHVALAVPGAVWPDSGMNAEGMTVAINAAHLQTLDQVSLQGGSNVQIMAQILKHAQHFEQAQALMGTWQRMRGNIIMITDGKSRRAGVFELLGQEMGVRELNSGGVLYATNHFVAPATVGKDVQPQQSTLLRYQRFQQLLEPHGAYSRYGKLAPKAMVEILRDRVNSETLQPSSPDIYDDNASIGGNGALRQEVFDPDRLLFWVTSGHVPIPENPFVCFSLGEMLGLPNAAPCESVAFN